MSKHFIQVIFFLLSQLIYAQYEISGIVIDQSTGYPLPGAHVSLQDTRILSISNKDGFYQMQNLHEEQVILQVSYLGYITYSDTFFLKKSMSKNISLQKNPMLMDAVIVKATRTGLPQSPSITLVSNSDIQANNLGQDIPDLLNQIPSLLSTSDAGTGIGYTGIRIRGTDPSRINVTINGIALNDPESQNVYWVDLPDFASSLENIQVQRGVGYSTNGAGSFGATINLQTQSLKEKSYAELSNTGGSFGTHKHMLRFGSGLINNHFAIDGRLSGIWSDGFIDRATSDLRSYYLSASYYANDLLIKAMLFSGREKTYQAWYGVPEEKLTTDRTYNFYTYENEIDRYGQDHFQIHFSKNASKDFRLTGALHYTHGAGYYEQFRENDAFSAYGINNLIIGLDTIESTNLIRRRWLDNDYYGFTFSTDWNINTAMNLIIGLAGSTYQGAHFGKVIWAAYASQLPIGYMYYDNIGQKNEGNIFAKLNWQIAKKSTLTADMQVRQVNYSVEGIDNDQRKLSEKDKLLFFNPKLGFHLPFGNHAINMFAGIANREPSRDDYLDGKDPKPETLYNIEIGISKRRKSVQIQGNVYYMYYNDQLVLTGELNDVGNPVRKNVKSSCRAGFELMADWKIWNKLTWRVNTTLSSNKIKNFEEVVYVYDEVFNPVDVETIHHQNVAISFSPAWIASSQINYQPLKWMQIGLLSKMAGKQYLDNTGSEERAINPYVVNDLIVNLNFKTKTKGEISFNLKISNLLNELYESNGYTFGWINQDINQVKTREFYNYYYPQAGRFYLVGMDIKL